MRTDRKTASGIHFNRIMEMIIQYGDSFDLSQDISTREADKILDGSHSRMEIAENAYLYGHMIGSRHNRQPERRIPLYDIPQLSDDEWNAIAARNKAERMVEA